MKNTLLLFLLLLTAPRVAFGIRKASSLAHIQTSQGPKASTFAIQAGITLTNLSNATQTVTLTSSYGFFSVSWNYNGTTANYSNPTPKPKFSNGQETLTVALAPYQDIS